MNKLELIQALKDATDLSKSQAATVVEIFLGGMTDVKWGSSLPLTHSKGSMANLTLNSRRRLPAGTAAAIRGGDQMKPHLG
jgi:hypothetical protein